MPKYLIYGGTPFEHENIDERLIVEKNMFGNNVGNELFFNGTVRSLSDRPEEEMFRLHENRMRLNEFDGVILPLANTIRKGCEKVFIDFSNLINGSQVPFVITGVGIGSTSNLTPALSPEVVDASAKFFHSVLERTASIGVRGEETYEVCVNDLGISKDRIKVIGCPSVRFFGKQLKKHPRMHKNFSQDTKIAVYFTAYSYDNEEAIFLYNIFKHHRRSFVFFTDTVEAELLWNGKAVPQSRIHDLLPTYRSHFMLREGRARFFATQKRLMGCLCTFDFTIGTRIHGIIASILSGVPSLLICSSLRTLEIAKFHNIPYIMRSEINEKTSLETLYYKTCMGMMKFYNVYDKQLEEYTSFLRENNLTPSKNF